jgi:hypothetical protein
MFRNEYVVDSPPPSAGKFGKVQPNDDDTYDKEIYLSEYDLIKFASSMNEIS